MLTIQDYREIFGSCFLSETPDGQVIPWKPLSIENWIKYTNTISSNLFAPSIIFQEIFRLCVLDKTFVDNIDKQKIGTIQLVVENILEMSGPKGLSGLDNDIKQSRTIISTPIHQFVSLICQAFQGYTPDDVYKMDYETLLLRLALAEDKLLKTGILKEPIMLSSGEEEQQPVRNKRKSKIDTKKLKEEFEKEKNNWRLGPKEKPKKAIAEEEKTIDDKIEKGKVIIPKEAHMAKASAGIDYSDLPVEELKMLQDARKIYASYYEQLNKGEKINIPSQEEIVVNVQKQIEKEKQELLINKQKQTEQQKLQKQALKKKVLPRKQARIK
jgi:hypothetical protein